MAGILWGGGRVNAYAPLPIRDDWAPSYLKGRGDANRDFAFKVPDPEGARAPDGGRYHGAVDWFAPGGTPVVAPAYGKVIEVRRSAVTTGQVFGGTLKLEELGGYVFVMRHINPRRGLKAGDDVKAREEVGTVTKWRSGSPHLHLEVWRNAAAGYQLAQMIDPKAIEWLEFTAQATYYFEELPEYRAEHPGERYRFGPWADVHDRDRTMRNRQQITGRTMRPFSGKQNSLYPWEDS